MKTYAVLVRRLCLSQNPLSRLTARKQNVYRLVLRAVMLATLKYGKTAQPPLFFLTVTPTIL